MAGPLGTTVFKIPNLAEKGYQIQKAEEEKQRREEEKREKEIDATGAYETYNKAKHLLVGDTASGATMLFNEFRKAAIDYEQTDSDSSRRKMEDFASQLELYTTAVLTQNNNAGKSLSAAEADGFQNYVSSPEDARQGYTKFINRSMEFTMKDGSLMVKDGEGFVPAFQSSYFSSDLNPNNSYLIPKAVEEGKYVIPRNFVSQFSEGIANAGTKSGALDLLDDELNYAFENNRAFVSDVAVHYAIETGLINGERGLTAQDIATANAKMSDPKIREKAFEMYKNSIKTDVNRMFERGTKKSINSLPSYGDIYEDKNVTMHALPRAVGNFAEVGMDQEGNYYVRTKDVMEDGMVVMEGAIRPATESEVARIEAATKVQIRPQQPGSSQSGQKVDREGQISQAPVTLREDMPINEEEIQSFIDAKSGSNSPITAKDIIDVSAKYNVPVELILAQGAMESNFGTKGRGARTKNIFNVGNTTSGDKMEKDSPEQKAVSRTFDSWIDGLDEYASLISRRYAPNGDWSNLLENFVNDEGNRYAQAPGYEDSLKNMINEFYDKAGKKSVSSQGGFDKESARSKYRY